METTLLATKLFIPPVAPGIVSRPRLLQRLQGVINSRLTLVSAPAGFGKTTLLSQWLSSTQPPIPAAWLSLEEAESDPVRFCEYLVAALRTIEPAVGETSLSLLRVSQPAPMESALTALINDIAGVTRDFVLVLDDYHVIQTEAVHRGVAFLIDHLPPKMHVIIATRVDPPLPLARLRGKGMLIEIATDDLRFSSEETAMLLAGIGAPALSARDLGALNARTEGWVAGLRMAMLSLRGEEDVAAFVAAFTGSQRYIMDYLFEEVLQKQPPAVCDFLLKTSILERLNGPLCDAVTGDKGGREMLLGLDKANLFLVPVDASREWYRYHQLFRDLLLHRLGTEAGDDEIRNLHVAASRWYEANGVAERAIDHALAARDWEKAMDLFVASNAIFAYGRLTTYNWLRQVPRDVLLTRPLACVSFAAALAMMRQFRPAKALIDSLEDALPDESQSRGQIAAIRAYIAISEGDVLGEAYAKRALSLLPDQEPNARAVLCSSLGGYYLRAGRYNEAEPLLSKACELFEQTNSLAVSQPAGQLATIAMFRGRLREAEAGFKRAIELGRGLPDVAGAYNLLGVVYWVWNDLEASAAALEKAIASNPENLQTRTASYLFMSGTRLAQGNIGAAEEALKEVDHLLADGKPAPRDRARVAAYHAAVALAQGDRESASLILDSGSAYEGQLLYDPISTMRLIHERRGEAIGEQLKADYDKYAKENLQWYLIIIRVGQALASPKPDEALSFLAEALAMGKPEGHIRTFVAWGMPLAPLLKEAISRGIEPDYARRLLDVIEAEERQRRVRKGGIPAAASSGGILSDREIEVLRLVADGLSNQEIAKKLTISLSTAKTHVYHLFDKLGARDRIQAATRAKELKLI